MSMYPDEVTIVIDGEQVSWPGLQAGKFTNGDFADPSKKPSFIPAETVNLILDNLAGFIAAVGGVPNNVSATQLADAVASAATARKLVLRDDAGRAKVTTPAAADDIATMGYVDQQLATKVMPVGALYLQLPGQSTPDTLFGGTWANVSSSYAGAFFRSEGGLALAFGGGVQGHAFQGHRHSYLRYFSKGGGAGGNYYWANDYIESTSSPISDGANGTPQVASETRPTNYTIRVWKRTA